MRYLQLREHLQLLKKEKAWIEFAMKSPAPTHQVQTIRENRKKLVEFKIKLVETNMRMRENRIQRNLDLIDTLTYLQSMGIKCTIKNNTIYL